MSDEGGRRVIDEKIAQRRRSVREGRRRARLRRTVTIGVLLLLVVALVAIERSALVGLEEIRVEGTERLEPDEVRRAADLELGTSTLRLRLGRVEERVAALPGVREASARRLDPLTVLIEVAEREPRLVVTSGGDEVLLDREGVVIEAGRVPGLPQVRLRGPLPEVGASVEEHPALANTVRAWRGLTGPLRSRVERYEARGPEALVLRLDTGVEVRIGRADRMAEKARALGVILEDLDGAEVSEIDVRAPGAPVVVP